MAKDELIDRHSESEAEPIGTAGERRYGPLDYLIVNVVFIAFCVLQFAVIKAITGEQIGLFFFFGVIVIGFILVSAFMYIFDVVAESSEEEESSGSAELP